MKARKSESDSYLYRLLNRIFLAILLLVMLYALLFSPEKQHHPVPSGSLLFSDHPAISTGLSRCFSAIVRLDFEAARQYNPYGIRVFLFFISQLLMRVIALAIVSSLSERGLHPLLWGDCFISAALFLFSFWPFISKWLSLFIQY